MKKIIIGILISLPTIIAIAVLDKSFLLETKVIVIFLLGIIASYYQAEYNPLKAKINDIDKGTVLQIIWTVYLTQAIALIELYFNKNETKYALNSTSLTFLTIAIFGLILRSWAYITLGKFFTMHLQTKSDQPLIQTGPYKYLRHPSYTGAYITYIFLPLFLCSYKSTLLSIALLLIAFVRRIKLEEQMLESHLGEKYKVFGSTRARLIPFIW